MNEVLMQNLWDLMCRQEAAVAFDLTSNLSEAAGRKVSQEEAEALRTACGAALDEWCMRINLARLMRRLQSVERSFPGAI